jgi:E3 ubiquitin-protein ligase SHPRH
LTVADLRRFAAGAAARIEVRQEVALRSMSPAQVLAEFEEQGLAVTVALRELLALMATDPPGMGTCGVCMDVMREPCVLRCSHAYCYECIQQVRARADGVVCPECRADTVTRGKYYRVVAADLADDADRVALTDARATVASPATVPSRVLCATALVRGILDDDATAKVLVFSSHLASLHALESSVDAPSMTITGSAPLEVRARHVAAFQDRGSPTRVCLLSSKASAAGLTLTAANHVILLEPATNSSAEAQAAARIHRIGQTRPVTVHRLAARGTVEARLLALAAAGDVPDTGMGCFGDSGAGLDAARKALDGRAA